MEISGCRDRGSVIIALLSVDSDDNSQNAATGVDASVNPGNVVAENSCGRSEKPVWQTHDSDHRVRVAIQLSKPRPYSCVYLLGSRDLRQRADLRPDDGVVAAEANETNGMIAETDRTRSWRTVSYTHLR